MTPAIDILLPTHRRPHTIGYSIRSILAQTRSDFTLHVIGDGCGADTEAAVGSCRDPRVRFYSFPKAVGYGYVHRNAVLRETSAPYIAYATDDDLWFPDHLEWGVELLERRTLDLVAFRSCHVQVPDRLDPHFFAFDWHLGPLSRFLRNWFMGSVTCLHRRRVFEQVGYWNDALFRFGDREFYNRVRVSGLPAEYHDVVTVLRFYAQHWDGHYDAVPDGPPQKRYLAELGQEAWRQAVRVAARPGRRSLAVRLTQWQDCVRFAVRSGPKFARFCYQRLVSSPPR